jgi:3',5'-cyclic AMP phosphodiesterase CpdA
MRKTNLNKRLVFLAALVAIAAAAPFPPVEIKAGLRTPFRFIAYGDTRFTEPSNTTAANPKVRQQLAIAIAAAQPDFIVFGGDIAYNGDNLDDWKVYDQETAVWRERRIPVYPALGNHDLHGDVNIALGNYFARFPKLRQSRFYSVRVANDLVLILDSSLDELTGAQGEWLQDEFKHINPNTDFIFIVMHHPPYTSSSDDKTLGGGHSARPAEQRLGAYLEEQQKKLKARIVVFAGHVHNYERHERGNVIYFVTGGGGAHAYPITRGEGDPFQSSEINYHYILVEVQRGKLKATMNRLEIEDGIAKWTQPDSVTVAPQASFK